MSLDQATKKSHPREDVTPLDEGIAQEISLTKLSEVLTGNSYREGNKLTILLNGDEIFPAMIEAIRKAEISIEMCSYVYWSGEVATKFAEALCERARAGVTTRLLLDAIGSFSIGKETIANMREAGVIVAWFRPVRWYGIHLLNNRTHRKILVVDGNVGFTGGVGIADEWTGNAQDEDHWRDTHCKVEGPACIDLIAGFADNWYDATGELVIPNPDEHVTQGDIAVQTTLSEASRGATTAEKLVLGVFEAAQEKLWVTSAYFVPTKAIRDAFIRAAARGVDVRILTNGAKGNHQITRLAGQLSYAALLRHGVRIFEYKPTVLHAKVITIDKNWSMLGSVNIDNRSLSLNDEIAISFQDKKTTAILDKHFEHDLERSHEIHLKSWMNRDFVEKLLPVLSGLFGRQL